MGEWLEKIKKISCPKYSNTPPGKEWTDRSKAGRQVTWRRKIRVHRLHEGGKRKLKRLIIKNLYVTSRIHHLRIFFGATPKYCENKREK